MVEQIGIFPQEYPLVAHDKQQDFSMAYCLFSCSFYKTHIGFSTNNPVTCPPFSYFCDNGQCVSEYSVCDGIEDCYDDSDEIGCSELRIRYKKHFSM